MYCSVAVVLFCSCSMREIWSLAIGLLFPKLARQSDFVSFEWLKSLSIYAKDSDTDSETLKQQHYKKV